MGQPTIQPYDNTSSSLGEQVLDVSSSAAFGSSDSRHASSIYIHGLQGVIPGVVGESASTDSNASSPAHGMSRDTSADCLLPNPKSDHVVSNLITRYAS